jgi:outer membrane protein TolC
LILNVKQCRQKIIRKAVVIFLLTGFLFMSGCATNFLKVRDSHLKEYSQSLEENSRKLVSPGQSLTLEECIEIALLNNLDVRLAEINNKLASIDRSAAFSYFLPQIDVNITRLDHDKQQMQKAGGSYMVASDKKITQKVISGQMALFNPSTWFIYTAFKKGANIQDLVTERVRQAIRLQITALYLGCLSQEASGRAMEVSVEQARALAGEVEALYREGLVLKSSLEDARLYFESQKNALAENIRMRAEARAELMEAMGLSPLAGISLESGPSFRVKDEDLSDQILSAMVNRLELKVADRTVAVRKDMVKISIANFLPAIGIFADYTNSSNSFQFYDSILSYGGSGVLTLFDGFKNVQEYRTAKKEHEKAMVEREQSCLKIMREVIRARNFYEHAGDIKRMASMELNAAASNLREVQALWREGMVTSSEKLDATGRYSQAEANVSLADYQYQVAIATLNDVMGLSGKEERSE